MFEQSSDVSRVSAADLVVRDLKEYELDGGRTRSVAQIETVGTARNERLHELLAAVRTLRASRDHVVSALIVTDILARGTTLLAARPEPLVERAFGRRPVDGVRDLAGVMSCKKQVAPVLLAAAAGG
jgi:manganese-dependent inorganic pyrophosphatase